MKAKKQRKLKNMKLDVLRSIGVENPTGTLIRHKIFFQHQYFLVMQKLVKKQ